MEGGLKNRGLTENANPRLTMKTFLCLYAPRKQRGRGERMRLGNGEKLKMKMEGLFSRVRGSWLDPLPAAHWMQQSIFSSLYI